MSGPAPIDPIVRPALDRESLRTMPAREINARWDEIRSLMQG